MSEKKWRLVVERIDPQGLTLQKDVSQPLELAEAVVYRSEMATVYLGDGWIPQKSHVQLENPNNGETVLLYVSAG